MKKVLVAIFRFSERYVITRFKQGFIPIYAENTRSNRFFEYFCVNWNAPYMSILSFFNDAFL